MNEKKSTDKEDKVYLINEELNNYLIFSQFSFYIFLLITGCYSIYGFPVIIVSCIILLLILAISPGIFILLIISPILFIVLLVARIIQYITGTLT